MKVIKVCLKERSYDIVIGSSILGSLGRHLKKINIGKDAVIITNPLIKKRWGKILLASLVNHGFNARFEEVADTEKSKSIKTCLELLNNIARYGRLRQVFIIAFGGGVIGDLAGFVASVYKRGIPYIQIPTTLVSQVDSSIGGKVAIDLPVGKNLVGSFYQPKLVFSEIDFLTTLPPEQIRGGLSEVIKYGIIKDPELFKFVEENLDAILNLDKECLEFITQRSSLIKAKIVGEDEFDKLGIRAILNYGHTIGHAIEAAGGYSKNYTHGNSISIGIIAANLISKELGLLKNSICESIENLLSIAGLPTRVKGISPSDIYQAHLYDKKFIHGKNRFVLPIKIGRTRIAEDVPEKMIKKAVGLICKN